MIQTNMASQIKSTSFLSSASNLLLLIDGHALIYRAYYALASLTNSQGEAVNAVYGFARILLRVLQQFKPTYLGVVFDHQAPTFRHQLASWYKANRPPMPIDLRHQLEMVKELVTTLNIPIFEQSGFEADDLLGTISLAAQSLITEDGEALSTLIVSSDHDLLQLIDERTHLWMPARSKKQTDKEFDILAVKAKMGVWPNQIADLKALMGDVSDNIMGVAGIGLKTAQAILNCLPNIKVIIDLLNATKSHLDITDELLTSYQLACSSAQLKKLITAKVWSKLQKDKDKIQVNQQLTTIIRNIPIKIELEKFRLATYDKQLATDLLQRWGFRSLIPLLPEDWWEERVSQSLFDF